LVEKLIEVTVKLGEVEGCEVGKSVEEAGEERKG
jgi:hypothetical protein